MSRSGARLPELTPEQHAARAKAISAGQRRRHARNRAVRLIRQTIPDFDLLLGEQVKAVVIVLERAEDLDER